MSPCPISHWRHGSPARPRELTPDEKRARLEELRASYTRIALSRALKPLRDASDAFYRTLFGEVREQSVPQGRSRGHQDYGITAQPTPAYYRPSPIVGRRRVNPEGT